MSQEFERKKKRDSVKSKGSVTDRTAVYETISRTKKKGGRKRRQAY